MTIETHGDLPGVDVHLSPDECELFIRLASDLEKAHCGNNQPAVNAGNARSYFSLSAELGQKIRALAERSTEA
jgi:hypothetical protein